MQHVLISGGTGLIGRRLIKNLQDKYKITVISRDPSRAKRLLGDNIGTVSLGEISHINDYSAIINLAGEPIADKRWTDNQKQVICDSRWDITTRLVDLINNARDKPEVFISGSAVGVYGRQGDTPIDEDFEDYHDEFSSQVCRKWESIALGAQTRVCIARTGIVLDENGGALAKMIMPFRLGLGGPISAGTQFMSWIHIEDMVKALEFMLTNGKCKGPYNFTAPNPNTNAFFSIKLAKRLDRPCIFRVPKVVIKTLMGESSDLVLYGQKVLPERLMAAGFTFSYPTLEEALNALDI
ncbi:epimerase family protein SH2119 [Glaciecola punicea ACAM 611]|jgi:hypothetical protein|uniref:Epimerase family protein SH2119 n=1 Tax=Glaciecola punicea ACAM 611 TaxID=1121923 RepID=H5TAH2_9ALTE|nr:TIGR01777 family oxidoreductase [Glaciecola punicea]GAB55299.1 epimerase family protein SH2119 [Glaciecola punicea ACAM 611]